MARKIETLRNIGVIAHIDAGKTTVTEHMLFYSGSKHRIGEVDKGTTSTDDNPEEQQRGITIYSACVTFEWNQVHVNLIDTPGHVDFTAEVERCLRVLDGAVVVFSAREGVEAQSETVWRQANRYRLPRIAFINKLDREGADFEGVLEEIRTRLQAEAVAVQIPVGQGPAHVADAFRGVIDLIEMEMLVFDASDDGRTIRREPIPEDYQDAAAIWRETMLEKLYNFSNEMMELALQEEPIPSDLIYQVLRECTIAHQLQPVFCGSALHHIGVQPVLDGVARYLPSPLDRPPIEGLDPKDLETKMVREPDPDAPFSALAFKVLPAKTGDIVWLRVYSGSLRGNSRLLNPGKDKKDNVAQLWQIHATKKDHQVEQVGTGDIVGVIGLRHTITGDTLCDAKQPILLESIEFPETVISMAIEPESTAHRDKLEETLAMLQRQDPTLSVRQEESGQTLISGMGELHLEVIKNRLLRDFKLNVKFHNPEVSYRETIGRAVEVVGECHRHIGGHQLFAKLKIRMEPLKDDSAGVQVLTQCPPDALTPELLTECLESLKACGEGGGLLSGYPLMRLRVTILGAEMHEEGSDEVAFRIAVNDAFERGLREGGPVLLEPVMRLRITTPEEYLGDFVGDLQKRRGLVERTETRGNLATIEAHAPLKELFGYASAMRGLSQGRAGVSMEPLCYAPASAEDQARFQ